MKLAKNSSNLWLATRKAEIYLADNDHSKLPICLDRIAAAEDILIRAKPDTVQGVSGMLIRSGDNFGIMYATHLSNEGFERFSIAHEFGHYMLDGHLDHLFVDSNQHLSHAGFISGDKYEQEADRFAVGLLMPEKLFKAASRKLTDGLEAIESMAAQCRTSITSTAIRYAQLADTSIAIIVSTNKLVDYCFMSDSMRDCFEKVKWPKKESPLHTDSQTYHFNSGLQNIEGSKRITWDVDIRDWLGGQRALPGTEEVLGLGSYGKTLTVLTMDISPEDEDDDAELEERWTARL